MGETQKGVFTTTADSAVGGRGVQKLDDTSMIKGVYRWRRGAALVTTTLLGVVAAGLVLVLVTVTLVDVRSGFVVSETAAATDSARNAAVNYAARLTENPLYHLAVVDSSERARVCAGTVYQPNTTWPAACGSVWTYQTPDTEADVRLEIVPPNPYHPQLDVVAVAQSGGVVAGWKMSFTQTATSDWTLAADTSIDMPVGLSGASIYSAQSLTGANGGGGSVMVAEDVIDVGERNQDSLYLQGPDARSVVAAPLQTTSLAGSMTAASIAGCGGGAGNLNVPAGVAANWQYVGGSDVSFASSVCLRRGATVTLTGGTEVTIPNNATGYLLIPQERTLRLFVATKTSKAPRSDVRGGSLPSLAEGTHPGGLGYWEEIGEVWPPASGVVVSDIDIHIGLCGDGFVGGTCLSWQGSNQAGGDASFTVIAGSASVPANVWLAGPLGGRGRITVAAFGDVIVPYWAVVANGQSVVNITAIALGRGLQVDETAASSPIHTYPTIGGSEPNTTVILRGSLAAPDLNTSGLLRPFTLTVQPNRVVGGTSPYAPAYSSSWVSTLSGAVGADSVCGRCQTWGLRGVD